MSCYNAFRQGSTYTQKKANFRREPCVYLPTEYPASKAFGYLVKWCPVCRKHYNESYPKGKPPKIRDADTGEWESPWNFTRDPVKTGKPGKPTKVRDI